MSRGRKRSRSSADSAMDVEEDKQSPKKIRKRRSSSASSERRSDSRMKESVHGEGVVHLITKKRFIVKADHTGHLVMSFISRIRQKGNEGPKEGQRVKFQAVRSRHAEDFDCDFEAVFMECVGSSDTTSTVSSTSKNKRTVTLGQSNRSAVERRRSSSSEERRSSSKEHRFTQQSTRKWSPPPRYLRSVHRSGRNRFSLSRSRSRSPFSTDAILNGRGRVTYAGPRCSLVKDWSSGHTVFFYNHSLMNTWPQKDMLLDFEAFYDRKYIRKHRIWTRYANGANVAARFQHLCILIKKRKMDEHFRWEASWLSEVSDLRKVPEKKPGIHYPAVRKKQPNVESDLEDYD